MNDISTKLSLKITFKNYLFKKGKKTRQVYALLGGNTVVLIPVRMALITQLRNKTKLYISTIST